MFRRQVLVTAYLLFSFVALVFFVGWLKGVVPEPWGRGRNWQYTQRVVFVVFPLAMMFLLRRKPSRYGLGLAQVSCKAAGGLAIAAWLIILPWVARSIFSGFSDASRSMNLGLSVVLFALATGFSEEYLFRGFYQSEWNRVFPRRFALGRTKFGWAVFITAGVFGFAHTLGNVNLLQGMFAVEFLPFFIIGFHGIVYGILREYFGGIIAPALIHAGWNLAYDLYPSFGPGRAAAIVAYVTACILLLRLMEKNKTPLQPSPGAAPTANQ